MTIQRDPEPKEIKYLYRFADFTDKRVLEIGCGEGRLTWQYARLSRYTIGFDIDAVALRVAWIDRPSDLQTKALFSRAESEYLPFHKETFDMALLSWSF